jgi:hypothetical protein
MYGQFPTLQFVNKGRTKWKYAVFTSVVNVIKKCVSYHARYSF